MPRSKLLGRRQKAVTTIHRDPDGQISEIETVWDPEWLDEDYAWSAAYLRWLAGKCPGCKLDLVDTTAMHDGDPVHTFEVPTPRRCHACDARLLKQEEHAKKKPKRPGALLWHIERTS